MPWTLFRNKVGILTGHRPYQFKSRIFREIARVVCEELPTRPSVAIGTKQGLVALEGPNELGGAFQGAHLPLCARFRINSPIRLRARD